MGCFSSKDVTTRKENKLRTAKVLLLGTGESGKSTILKQMRLLHDGGFATEEREEFKNVIYSNVMQSMRALLMSMKAMRIPLQKKRERSARLVLSAPNNIETLSEEMSNAIQDLWKDEGVKKSFVSASQFHLSESAAFYFENMERIAKENYMPTDQDILQSRVKTTGIVETDFVVGDMRYLMVDLGGQRSERKKWVICFENVTAVLFLVAINEFDQMLAEDNSTNRLMEALILFESICNSRWFRNTSIILFLNKIDLFREKLKRVALNKHFAEYDGTMR